MKTKSDELIKSVGSNSLDLLAEYGEVLIDATTDSEVIKDIPVLGTFLKVANIGVSIRDNMFINKLKIFLLNIKNIPIEQREDFVAKYLSGPKDIPNIGEKLLHIIDSIDSEKKAEYVGKSFSYYISGEIDKIQFYDLIFAIENLKMHYLDMFIDNSLTIRTRRVPSEILNHFMSCGLVLIENRNEEGIIAQKQHRERINYGIKEITFIGEIFLEKIIEYDAIDLMEKFRHDIMDLKILPDFKHHRYEFVRNISKRELKELLLRTTLPFLLQHTAHQNYTECSNVTDYDLIARKSENQYSLYKRI